MNDKVRKVTVRQLQVGDMLTATGLVVVDLPEDLQHANGVVGVVCVSQYGARLSQAYPVNQVVNVVRDYDDPTNNPYWWALEAEREREEDEAVARREMEETW